MSRFRAARSREYGDVLARVVACQIAVAPQDAVDALHYVDTVLVRQGHVRRVHDVLQLFQFPGRFFDDACVACGDGRELRGREVLVADHAAITVNVDVRDFAHEQNTLLHLAGRADEVADGFQGVVVSLVE